MTRSRTTTLSLLLFTVFIVGCASSSKPTTEALLQKLNRTEQKLAEKEDELETLSRQLLQAQRPAPVAHPPPKKEPAIAERADAELESIAIENSSDDFAAEALPGKDVAHSAPGAIEKYFVAQAKMQTGDYEAAVQQLHSFLLAQPNHPYADRAQYLLEEAHFKNHEYGLAIVASNVLENRYPDSFRLPEGLVRRAEAYFRLNQTSQGKNAALDVLRRFPASPVTKDASRLLSASNR